MNLCVFVKYPQLLELRRKLDFASAHDVDGGLGQMSDECAKRCRTDPPCCASKHGYQTGSSYAEAGIVSSYVPKSNHLDVFCLWLR